MKKYLAILGLALAISQPGFAASAYAPTYIPHASSCAPCIPSGAYMPRVQSVVLPIQTGAACPCPTACPTLCPTQCPTGMAAPVIINTPVAPCNPCAPQPGFWQRFFGF